MLAESQSSHQTHWVAVDAHVHLQQLEDAPSLFDAGYQNLLTAAHAKVGRRPGAVVLLLAEVRGQRRFDELASCSRAGAWTIAAAEQETYSLNCARNDGAQLTVIAGRQIVTAERIEVLALGCAASVQDGSSLEQTLDAVHACDGIPVLPWGFGKWSGRRGTLVKKAFTQAPPRKLFLGDSAGRPILWPEPELFQLARERGSPLLSGTDPLPLPREHLRVGSRGSLVRAQLGCATPAADLKQAIRSPQTTIEPIGRGAEFRAFVRKQLALRMHSNHAVVQA